MKIISVSLVISPFITLCTTAEAQNISLLFAGDAMQHQAQIDDAKKENGEYCYSDNFKYIKDEISSVDISVVNLETPLATPPYSGYPAFCAPSQFAHALKECGFDLFLTANNHCLDKGSKGIRQTINTLDSLKIYHTGIYKNATIRQKDYPLIMKKGDLRIAFLNYTYGTNGITAKSDCIIDYIDTVLIKNDINAAQSKSSDIIIASLHWGEEYKLLPSESQRHLARWLHKAGVRIVIGSHPHVIQPIEIETNNDNEIEYVTVYSLGNFISNMRTKMTMGAIIFKLNIEKDGEKVTINAPQYSKIFTQRPVAIQGSPFCIIAADSTTTNNNKLPLKLRSDIKIFSDEADRIFSNHNKGSVYEYFWSKNIK
ncbi:MAG: CapA family protein [Bacteroidales bacterium]